MTIRIRAWEYTSATHDPSDPSRNWPTTYVRHTWPMSHDPWLTSYDYCLSPARLLLNSRHVIECHQAHHSKKVTCFICRIRHQMLLKLFLKFSLTQRLMGHGSQVLTRDPRDHPDLLTHLTRDPLTHCQLWFVCCNFEFWPPFSNGLHHMFTPTFHIFSQFHFMSISVYYSNQQRIQL